MSNNNNNKNKKAVAIGATATVATIEVSSNYFKSKFILKYILKYTTRVSHILTSPYFVTNTGFEHATHSAIC
jgi:formylmethanofuran dehydrogenase subunit E-like metal-binding protein